MAGYWLKLYTEILDDPKYFRLSDNAKLGMIELMIVAKRVDMEGEVPCIDDVAFYTRRSIEWWQPVFDELSKIEYLVKNGAETIIRKFAERQKPVDDAERMRQARALKHKKEFVSQECHETVTNRNGDTEIDTEKIKETDEEKKKNHFFVGEFLRISEIPGISSNYQGDILSKLKDKYGEARLLEFAEWCNKKGILTIEDALKSAETALPKWKKQKEIKQPEKPKKKYKDVMTGEVFYE